MKFGSVVELLKVEKENDNLFTDFPLGLPYKVVVRGKEAVVMVTYDIMLTSYSIF